MVARGNLYRIAAKLNAVGCFGGVCLAVKLHIAYNLTVGKLYYSVGVLLGKFAVVRYNYYKLCFG